MGAAELRSSPGRKGRRSKAVSQEGKNQTKPLWRFAAKAERWAGRCRKGGRHLHLPVCCLRPEEDLNLEQLIRDLPGEPSTGTKPSTCTSGATCQTGLMPACAFSPSPGDCAIVFVPLRCAPCVLCPGQGDLRTHLSPQRLGDTLWSPLPFPAESRIAAAICWDSSLPAAPAAVVTRPQGLGAKYVGQWKDPGGPGRAFGSDWQTPRLSTGEEPFSKWIFRPF